MEKDLQAGSWKEKNGPGTSVPAFENINIQIERRKRSSDNVPDPKGDSFERSCQVPA